MYLFIISRSFLRTMRSVSDKSCRENQNTHFVFRNYFRKTVPFMRKLGKVLCSGAGHRRQCDNITLQMNAPQCYVTCTLPVLFHSHLNVMLHALCLSCFICKCKKKFLHFNGNKNKYVHLKLLTCDTFSLINPTHLEQ
jgi:hypothetical protein